MKKLIPIITACLIAGLVISYFAFWQNTGSTVTNPPLDQDGITSTEPEIDTDGDGLSDWFEKNIADLDPSVPNDRYAIILNTNTIHPNPYYTNQRREEATNLRAFLIEEEGFKPENSFLFMDMDATHTNFKNAIDYITEHSDKNDLVYIMINAHGSEAFFHCHSGKNPSEIEVSEEQLEGARESYSEDISLEEIYIDQQIRIASWGRSVSVEEINEFVSRIEHKKMFLVIDTCGLAELPKQISTVNLVTAYLSGCLSQFMTGKPWGGYNLTDTNGDSYLSVKELFDSLCDNLYEPSRYATREEQEQTSVFPKMFDPQEIADDFYFGQAKITDYNILS